MAALLASGPGRSADESLLLAEFPASLESLPWRVVNDGVMGGRSEGDLQPESDSLVFSGITNTEGGGFASIRCRTHRFDLDGYTGVRVRLRGDGRDYTFRLTTWKARTGRYEPSYWAEFQTRDGEWMTVDVPFSRFRPRWRGRWLDGPALDPGAIDGLGLMIYDGRDGPFRLEVDWIRAYRPRQPFSMAAYRWQKRPLLIFAKSESSPPLQQQLAAVEATRDLFEERDMVLIVVLAAGPSQAGDGPLSENDGDRLREAYGVREDTFAVRLVGKDGGVKRQADEIVPMEELYDLIDSMPMRQQEMRR
jgi:NADH dehydrogenase [ubiquinone] 1 alpha subcomplex assembly factor 1